MKELVFGIIRSLLYELLIGTRAASRSKVDSRKFLSPIYRRLTIRRKVASHDETRPREGERSETKKKTMAPGRQVEDLPTAPLLPFVSPRCFPYRGPPSIYSRGHSTLFLLFIIIVIIISVDGLLMNRCEDSGRPARLEKRREREREEEKEGERERERRRKR